jgi:hypothetical protein
MAWWLVLCLLFSQWMGYAHAINHAGLQTESVFNQHRQISYNSGFDHQQANHSCASLDASSLGASITLPFYDSRVIAPKTIRIVAKPPSGWQQLVNTPFSSRAPPYFY